MPSDLKAQIDKLEEIFTVSTTKLKEISDHFVSELQRGLSKEGGTIVGCIGHRDIKGLIKTAHDPYLVHGIS
jgi:hexokinase